MRAEFLGELFQYKTALFQQEILSVLVTPLILIYSLPEVRAAYIRRPLARVYPPTYARPLTHLTCPHTQCAPAILSFLRQHAATVDGLGSVCAFSLFDLDKYGSPLYGGGGGGSSGDGDKPPKRVWEGASEGKVEKSLLNFCVNYPEWARAQAQAAAAAAAAAAGLQHATGSPASTTGSASGAGSGAALVLLGRLQAFQEAELARRREEQERALAEALKGAGNGDVAKSLLMLGAWQQQQQAGMAGGAFGGGPNLGMSYRGPGGMGGSYMQSSGYWGPQPPQQPLQYSALMLPPPPAANATGASAPFGGEGGGGGMYLPPHMVQGAGMGMGGGGAEMESSFYWLQRYAERFEQLEREREEREAGGGGGGGQERWRAGQEEADQKVAGGAKSASSPALGPAPATGTAGVPPSAAVPSTVL